MKTGLVLEGGGMRAQIDYLRASASLPFVSRIVEIEGKKYLDGGCADSIPLEAFIKTGYGRNVVILTREKGYRKKKSRKIAGLFYRKYPEFTKVLNSRNEEYNASVERVFELEKGGSVFVIKPDAPLNIGRLEKNPEKVQEVYDRGRADGEKCAESLIKWLAEGK